MPNRGIDGLLHAGTRVENYESMRWRSKHTTERGRGIGHTPREASGTGRVRQRAAQPELKPAGRDHRPVRFTQIGEATGDGQQGQVVVDDDDSAGAQVGIASTERPGALGDVLGDIGQDFVQLGIIAFEVELAIDDRSYDVAARRAFHRRLGVERFLLCLGQVDVRAPHDRMHTPPYTPSGPAPTAVSANGQHGTGCRGG
jgi:hypothetical protein